MIEIDNFTIVLTGLGVIGLLGMGVAYLLGWFKKEEEKARD